VDELADAAKVDPVEFRLQNLSDPRARTVIETAARMSRWDKNAARAGGRAAGIAFCRYKTTAAYVAAVAQVEVSEQVRVTRVDCAVDAGLAINPDGVINQVEGGIVQSISWTLKERIAFGPAGTTARTWEDYPILGFDEVPEIHIELIRQQKLPPLGVGEAAHGPVGGAIANAVACAGVPDPRSADHPRADYRRPESMKPPAIDIHAHALIEEVEKLVRGEAGWRREVENGGAGYRCFLAGTQSATDDQRLAARTDPHRKAYRRDGPDDGRHPDRERGPFTVSLLGGARPCRQDRRDGQSPHRRDLRAAS